MKVIINADDFGWDDDTVEATIECMERGQVTSATIMANMPATERAIRYARSRPDLSFGAHLVYGGDGDERPVSPPSAVSSLIDDTGAFLQSNKVRWRALAYRVSIADVERETNAQLARLTSSLRLSHVDSHGHLHKFGLIRRALARTLPAFGIRKVRNAQDVFAAARRRSVTYWVGPVWRWQLMQSFRTTQHFFMPEGTPGESWSDALCARLSGASIEVGVHPGRNDSWRAEQMAAVAHFAERVARLGHALVGWKDL